VCRGKRRHTECACYFGSIIMTTLTGEEKGALLLKNLAPEIVDSVLAQLGPERGQRLRALMQDTPPTPETEQALEELIAEMGAAMTAPPPPTPLQSAPPRPVATEPARPAPPPVRETVRAAANAYARASQPPDDGNKLGTLDPELVRAIESGKDPLETLARLPAQRLALALEGENARTVSLLLNYLHTDLAGSVFKRLSPELRNQVTIQFGNQGMPPVAVLERIALAILKKSCTLVEKPTFPAGTARFKKIADMLRMLDKPERFSVIKELEEKDPTAAGEVKSYLYRFEDILRIDNRSLQKVLMDLDTKSLAAALKGGDDTIKAKFMGSLSKRAQETLAEEMELMQTVKSDERDQAQKEIVAVIQRLDLAGELVME
jgi:flagellar motor switch protein FliG